MKTTSRQDYSNTNKTIIRKELLNNSNIPSTTTTSLIHNSEDFHTKLLTLPSSNSSNMLLLHTNRQEVSSHHTTTIITNNSSSSSMSATSSAAMCSSVTADDLSPHHQATTNEEKYNNNNNSNEHEKVKVEEQQVEDVATQIMLGEEEEEDGITRTISSLHPSPSPTSSNNNTTNNSVENHHHDERGKIELYIDANTLHLPLSPSTLSVSSCEVDDGTPTKLPSSTNCSPARPLSALLNISSNNNNTKSALLSSNTWWRERLFPKELLPNSSISSARASSSAVNFNISLIDESTIDALAPSSLSSSRLDAVHASSSSEGEFSEETLLEHTSKELCTNMSEEELELISTPAVVDYVLREMKFSKQKCSIVHLAAKHNRVELLQWFKRCCCDKKCTYKHMPISKLVNSDKSSSLTDTTFSILENNKRFSRNFGRNFNVAIRHFDSLDDDSSSQHSKQCLLKQQSLWFASDNYSATPLFYSCKNPQAMEASAFLLSQPSVSQKQLNHHHDQFGNLPITIGFRSGNFRLCDLLVLFGAKIDVTSGILAESLLHKVCRDGADLEVVKYLARNAPKILLKRNQRDESALFACIRDLRVALIPSTGGSFSSDISLFHNRKSSNGVSDTSFTLLHNILSYGSELFGRETFEKAVLMKNSFGMNILMASILYNDVDAMKVISLALSNYCKSNGAKKSDLNTSQISSDSSASSGSEGISSVDDLSQIASPRKRNSLRLRLHQRILSMDKRGDSSKNILKTIVFDKDKQGKTVLHLMVEAAIQLEENGAMWEEMIDWFDGFQWLCLWLEQVFLQTLNFRTNGEWTADCGLCHFFEARDIQGYSPYGMVVAKQPNEEMNFMEKESTDDRALFWPRVLEFIQTTIKKWATAEKVKDTSDSNLNGSRNNFRYAEVRGSRGFFNSESDSLDSLYADQHDEGILGKMKRRFKRTQSVDLDK